MLSGRHAVFCYLHTYFLRKTTCFRLHFFAFYGMMNSSMPFYWLTTSHTFLRGTDTAAAAPDARDNRQTVPLPSGVLSPPFRESAWRTETASPDFPSKCRQFLFAPESHALKYTLFRPLFYGSRKSAASCVPTYNHSAAGN